MCVVICMAGLARLCDGKGEGDRPPGQSMEGKRPHRLQHANQHSLNCHCEPVHSRSHAGSDIFALFGRVVLFTEAIK